MSSIPDISVVMSVYNNADTLAAAMDSILAQAGVSFEFVIIDDGSTDASARMLDDYARHDARIRVEHQPNRGLTLALIRGCELARSAWIARQDADDRSLPGRLSALKELADRNPGAAMLASSTRYVGPEGEDLFTVTCTTDSDLARRQICDLGIGPPAHGCVMFSRDVYRAVGGYRTCFYYGQDSDLWIRIAEVGPVVYTDNVLYEYRLSPGAISGARKRMQKEFGLIGQACRDARRRGEDEQLYLAQAEKLRGEALASRTLTASPRDRWLSYYHIGSLLEKRDPAKAAEYFRKAIACNAFVLRPRLKLFMQRLGC